MDRVYFGTKECQTPWPEPQSGVGMRRIGSMYSGARMCVTSFFFETVQGNHISFGKICSYLSYEEVEVGAKMISASTFFPVPVSQEQAYQSCLEDSTCKEKIQALLSQGYTLLEKNEVQF